MNNKRAFGFSKTAGHNHLVINNIFYEPNGPAIDNLAQPRNTVIDYNCYVARHGPGPGANSIEADPLFMNLSKNDFRLRPDSPCINMGRKVIANPSDVAGFKFMGRPDIGAFERLR